MPAEGICPIEGCEKPIRIAGLCSAHYHRQYRYGDPTGGGTAHGAPLRFLHEVVLNYQEDNCLKWPFGIGYRGYGHVWLNGKMQQVHRVVCEMVHGPALTFKHEAAHSCGKGAYGCCNPRHLSWKTRVENEQDKLLHGTRARGERNGSAKLTEEDVRMIRLLAGTMLSQKIADRFGVSQTVICGIIRRDRWSWLSD